MEKQNLSQFVSTYFISKFVYARFRLLNGGCRGVSAKSVRSVSLSKLDQKGKSLISFKHMLADPRDGKILQLDETIRHTYLKISRRD